MPSITNIPEHLRTPEQKTAFLAWLSTMPIDFAIARALAHLWSRATKTMLTNEDWLNIETDRRYTTHA